VTVGGTLDLGLRKVRNGSVGSSTTEVSGANSTSKLVIRGVEDLGNGQSAGFYLDGSLQAANGTAGATAPAGQFWDRRSTVSLTDVRYGELRLGRDLVPTHVAWSGFDPFATLGIASANTFRSVTMSRALGQAFGTAPESQAANSTQRVNQSLAYFLPGDLAGVYGTLIVTKFDGGTTASGSTNGNGFRLGWTGAGVNVGAAQFTTKNAAANDVFKDRVLGVSYDFGPAKVDLAQRRWVYRTDTTVNTQIGATVPAGPGIVKLTHVRANQTGATAALSANDASLTGAGYVYAWSARTALYGHVARIANQGAAAFAIAGGPAVSATATAANYFGGQKSTAYELGLRHDF
jgi:predicted porin